MDISSPGEHLVKVVLSGRLDTQGVEHIEAQFMAAVVPALGHAVVDLSQVNFVSSMGIRMLVSTAQNLRKRKARLVVYGAPPLVSQVFEAVSLQKILPICATEAEALAAAAASPA